MYRLTWWVRLGQFQSCLKCVTVEVTTPVSEGSAKKQSSDEDYSEDEEYDEAKSTLREWSSDQPAEASHVEGILLIEVLMREAGMSRYRAAQVAASYSPSSE